VKVLAVIPARSGSKSIRDKNIRLINGKPLIAYSIENAKSSKLINRIVVSTDSSKYAKIALRFGAEVPFLRPHEFSSDTATDLMVFKHLLMFLGTSDNYFPDICVHLRPTYPFRDPRETDEMINLLINNPKADSIRSISKSPFSPYKMWYKSSDGWINPVVQDSREKDLYNSPRQALPQIYLQNGSTDIFRPEVVLEQNSMTGSKIIGFEMNHFLDIDYPEELKTIRKIIRNQNAR